MPRFIWKNIASLGCCRTLTLNGKKPKPFPGVSPEKVNQPDSIQTGTGILELVLSSLEVGIPPLNF